MRDFRGPGPTGAGSLTEALIECPCRISCFKVTERSFQVILSRPEGDKRIASIAASASPAQMHCYATWTDALSELTQPAWLLVWAHRGVHLLCRDNDFYLPGRQVALLRAENLDPHQYQQLHGCVVVLPDSSISVHDHRLFACHAKSGALDSGWARLLGSYIHGLEADTLASLGEQASGWWLLENQIMELLRRALAEQVDQLSFSHRRETFETPDSRGEMLYKRLCAWLQENYTDPDLQSEQVAKHFNISSRYIQSLFSKFGDGLTFVSYLREQRLQRALTLLESRAHEHLPIAQLCWSCGFSDPVHFGKVFRRRFGMTPGQARRNAARSASDAKS